MKSSFSLPPENINLTEECPLNLQKHHLLGKRFNFIEKPLTPPPPPTRKFLRLLEKISTPPSPQEKQNINPIEKCRLP